MAPWWRHFTKQLSTAKAEAPALPCRCLRLLFGALQAIRRESDSRALVLLDEVGTGTDPGEGAALGVALLHALIRGGFGGASFTMATTHHRCLFMLTIHGAFGSL